MATDTRPTRRNWLAEATTEARKRPTAAVLYGVPGVGKTSMAAYMPGAVFLTDKQEDGINTLKRSGLVPDVPSFPPVSSWSEVVEILDVLATGEHSYKAVVLDALTGMERLCHEWVCNRDFHGEWGDRGFGGFKRGYDIAIADWRSLLIALDRLRDERNMAVLCLAHAKVVPNKNPDGRDWLRWVPDLHEKTWQATSKWADVVLFADYFVSVDTSNGRAKGRGGRQRVAYTEHDAAHEAKNRHGLPTELDMGSSGQEAWQNFSNAMRAATAKKGGE